MNHRILVVDDSLTIRMNLSEAFEASGFATELASTACEAQSALERGSFDLIVLDVVLPDRDGIELMKELKSSPRTAAIPIMLLSTEAEVAARVRGLETGADEYVGKPYDPVYLIPRARELMQRPHQEPERHVVPVILVIDDSPTFCNQLEQALDGAGYRTASAGTGEDGLRTAAHVRPDAIIVDGILPGMDGASVIRKLRMDAALRGTPCILLTASEVRDAELDALDSGADAFVRKEETMEVILARLGAVLRAAGDHRLTSTVSLLGPKRILAVDDSLTHLHELATQLRDEGYDVVLARSGEEALQMMGVQVVDCILLDLVMPGLSGQETCRRIKSSPLWRDIPLVMLTALEERESMIEGINAGADDYIAKSSDFKVLKARLRAQLRRKQFEDENRRIHEQLLRKEMEAAEARAALVERKRSAERIAALNEVLQNRSVALEAANQELEAFSYSVSHDLRTPLRHVHGYASLLRERVQSTLDEEARGFLDAITDSAAGMARMIEDLLLFSRMARTEMHCAEVDLIRLVEEVRSDLAADTRGRNIEWLVGNLPMIQGDRAMLKLALTNLLGNAIKYTAKCQNAAIEIDTQESETEQVVYVRDNGVGFDMEYAHKLFGAFQRLHGNDDFEGTGIGLANVRRIITRHGGRTWAEGAVGRGATFYFSLPRPRVSSSEGASRAA